MVRSPYLALAMLASAVFTAEARAAFLPPDFTQPWDQEAASGADSAQVRETDLPELSLDAFTLDLVSFALHGGGSSSPSGGAGSNVAPSLSVDLVAVAVPFVASIVKELGDYRLRESHCRLSVPFLSGVFRPPRTGE